MREEVVIGERVRIAREKKGYTQWQLAELIDISVPHLSDIENGKKEMGITIFRHLAQVLEVSANELLQIPAWDRELQTYDDVKAILEDCTNEEREMLKRLLAYNKKAIRDNNLL